MLNEEFDLIFIDPPYKFNIAIKSIEIILEKKLLAEDGLIVIETDDEQREIQEINKMNFDINIIDIRTYGRVKLIFLKKRKEDKDGNIYIIR